MLRYSIFVRTQAFVIYNNNNNVLVIHVQRAPMLRQYNIIYNNKSSFRSFRRGPHSAPGAVFGKFSGGRKKTSLFRRPPVTAVAGTDKMPRPRVRCCVCRKVAPWSRYDGARRVVEFRETKNFFVAIVSRTDPVTCDDDDTRTPPLRPTKFPDNCLPLASRGILRYPQGGATEKSNGKRLRPAQPLEFLRPPRCLHEKWKF